MTPAQAHVAKTLTDLLFENAGVGLCLVAPDGTVLRANAEWLRSTAYREEQVLGESIIDLFPETRDMALALHARARAGHRLAVPRHAQIVNARETWWEGTIEPVAMEGGTGLLITAREVTPGKQADVTAQKAADAALQARDAEFAALFEELHSGVALIDRSGRFTRCNRRFREMFGLSSDGDIENVNGQNWSAWQVFDDAGRLLDVDEHPVRRAALRRQPVRNQLVAVRLPTGGELVWMLVSAEPLLAPDGSFERIVCTYHEITAVKRAEQALRESEQRSRRNAAEVQAILDAVPAAVFIARDPEARRIDANRAGLELLGIRTGENASKTAPADEAPAYRVLRDGVDVPSEELPSQRAARGVEVRDWDCEVRLEDGTSRQILGYATPLRADDGTPTGSVTAFVDITDRKRAEAALRAANEQLREADRRKDEWIGMLSHELRNPLAPIRNSTYILEHATPGSEQARRAQDVIRRQSEHLTRLVDDLLDVTRIARGRIELRRSRVDLRDVIARAAEDFRVALHDRGIHLELAIPDEKLQADADVTRVTQIIGNLLHNATKFTRRGDTVALSITARGNIAEIGVRDTGAGIDRDLLPHVFEAFVQGERTLARTEGGLGLGLALVKGIAELHGGSVEARSAGKGHGAEFLVRLPMLERPEPDPQPSPRAEGSKGGRRVLVVDDNADAAESLADVVRMMGHTVEVAFSGADAIEMVRANPPSLVLCDIGLPGMSGYELVESLRASALPGAQLVALSGYAQAEDVKRAIDAGFDAHLAKPADPAQIEKLLS